MRNKLILVLFLGVLFSGCTIGEGNKGIVDYGGVDPVPVEEDTEEQILKDLDSINTDQDLEQFVIKE